jgi:predicted metal-dependent phosphotriesterase family hydrolase
MNNKFFNHVMTVTGPVKPSELGIIHSHEHVFWDYFKMIKSYDCVFDDTEIAIDELSIFKRVGGGTLVDCSSNGIATKREELPKISEKSGVKIVLGTGWYRESVYQDIVKVKTSNELSEILVRDIQVGFDGTNIKAGFIGEIGTERHSISALEERVFRAAAKASIQTGVAIVTHTTHFGELALEQINLLNSEGVNSDRIVISHLGDREDFSLLQEIAATGVYLSIDNIGYTGDGYPEDEVRLTNVLKLIEKGHENQIVLGTDIGSKTALFNYGGRGFGWLIESFIPKMISNGLDKETIEKLTVKNMAKVLTII